MYADGQTNEFYVHGMRGGFASVRVFTQRGVKNFLLFFVVFAGVGESNVLGSKMS